MERRPFSNAGRIHYEKSKGFTLAELLIVVAIIAVLVAIAIPVFTSQLEKARDIVTVSNLRTAYAEACDTALTDGKTTVGNIQITAKGMSGELSGLDKELPFTLTADSKKILGAGKGKSYYITFDFTNELQVKVTAGGAPYVGQIATREELDSRTPFFFYGDYSHVHIDDPNDSTKWLVIDPEPNKVYRMMEAYAGQGEMGYYRFDGTNWYKVNDEGGRWTLFTPPGH